MIYIVKSNIKHSGTEYEKGAKIDLNEFDARALLNDGVITSTETKEEELEAPQPAVNEVVREDADVSGKVSVQPGVVEVPQPTIGDEDETPEEKEAREEQEKVDAEAAKLAEDTQLTSHTVTEDDLIKFPSLVEKGVVVGDQIASLPTDEDADVSGDSL